MTSRPTNPARLERLRRLRDGGHLRYVLLHGVIGWGMCTAVSVWLVMASWEKEPFLDVLAVLLVTFAVGGVLFGEWMWWHIRITCDRLERDLPNTPLQPTSGG